MAIKRDKDFYPQWIIDLVTTAKSQEKTWEKLATKVGCGKSTAMSWETGTTPNAEHLIKLVELVGGDIHRALPDYEGDYKGDGIEVLGCVAAGDVIFTAEELEKERIPVPASLWKSSKYYCKSRKPSTTVLLKVSGDSMHPEYKDGELLVCKPPEDPKELLLGTPCIFREDDSHSFKLLGRGANGEVIGVPINSSFNFIVFKKSVQIPYIVLGKIDLG